MGVVNAIFSNNGRGKKKRRKKKKKKRENDNRKNIRAEIAKED